MDINLTSSFLVTREYLRGLQEAPESVKDNASIIFIGSSIGKFGEWSPLVIHRVIFLKSKKSECQEKRNMLIMLLRKVVGISSTEADLHKFDYLPELVAMMYGFTRSLKNEIVKIAPKGRVNCIAPGLTRTVPYLFPPRIGPFQEQIPSR